MMRYTFRALITLSPKVPEDPAPCCPGRAHALAARGCYLIQPFSCHGYLPAMISLDEGVPVSPERHAMLTVALADSEEEAFFSPGQHFTIWPTALSAAPYRPWTGSATVSSPAVRHRPRLPSMATGSLGYGRSGGNFHFHAAASRRQLAPHRQPAKFSRSSGAGHDGESGGLPACGARSSVMPGGATGQDPPRSAGPRPRSSPAMARDSRAGVVRSRRTPRRQRPSA